MAEHTDRKIIHIDMDAFFASVEQRDHPEWRGRPLVVGNDEPRGVVAAASYEARQFGVRSAMPSAKAKQLCPHLIFAPHRFERYKEVSRQIQDIFHEYTDLVEPLSLDEAFLDVTENKSQHTLAVEIAREIKRKIWEQLELTASAGISYNKFLAKVASEQRKPNGICTIHPSQAQKFIDRLPIEAFWGVGKVTARRMHKMGIFDGYTLRQYSLNSLTQAFGKTGELFYYHARGIDLRPVMAEWIRKSVGCERTLDRDITQYEEVMSVIKDIATQLEKRLTKAQFKGNTLTLKIKFFDFKQITRSQTVQTEVRTLSQLLSLAEQLLAQVEYAQRPIRLIGLSVSHPQEEIESTPTVWQQLEIPFPL